MTNYELLKMTESLMQTIVRNKIDVKDVKYLQLYADFVRLKKEGHKIGYVVIYLSSQYECSEATVYRVINRMKSEVK